MARQTDNDVLIQLHQANVRLMQRLGESMQQAGAQLASDAGDMGRVPAPRTEYMARFQQFWNPGAPPAAGSGGKSKKAAK